MWTKLKAFFINHINWCEAEYYDGTPKPQNKVVDFFYKYWLFPFSQNDCLCCNTVRGVMYGIVIGWLLAWLL